MRGYDPQQVNEHLAQLEGEVRQHKDQVQAMHRELAEAHRQLQEQERPTYSGLGARIEQLLRLAEEQATELVQAAGPRPTRSRPRRRWTPPRCAPPPKRGGGAAGDPRRETDDVRGAADVRPLDQDGRAAGVRRAHMDDRA